MPRDSSRAPMRAETARALVAGVRRQCPGCGQALTARQRACSGRCRAKLSRQRKADELRVLALAARQALEALEQRLENRT